MTSSRRIAFCLALLSLFPALNVLEGRCLNAGGYGTDARNGESGFQAAKDLEDFFRAQINDFKLADLEKKRPVKSDTIFTVGSVSKTVTLAAFMRLWEQGTCALDDDINKYLSFPVRNPRFPDKPITIRVLLSFTSGIFDVDFQAGQNRLSFLDENRGRVFYDRGIRFLPGLGKRRPIVFRQDAGGNRPARPGRARRRRDQAFPSTMARRAIRT